MHKEGLTSCCKLAKLPIGARLGLINVARCSCGVVTSTFVFCKCDRHYTRTIPLSSLETCHSLANSRHSDAKTLHKTRSSMHQTIRTTGFSLSNLLSLSTSPHSLKRYVSPRHSATHSAHSPHLTPLFPLLSRSCQRAAHPPGWLTAYHPLRGSPPVTIRIYLDQFGRLER